MKAAFALAMLAVTLSPSGTYAQSSAPTARLLGPVLNAVAIDRELQFYETAFGLKPGMTLDHGTRREYMLRFSADPAEAGLILVHDSGPDAPTSLTHGNGFDRIVLRVTDMDALVARLDAAGIGHDPVHEAARGYRVLQLRDPEGYPLEVIQSGSSAGAAK
ncbi:VOC family protein [Novosphingobium sp. BL-8H]|uniref:VOC family protein n=1 Tax=Novosphingobium sp. BL-8H TaxID=3127640 RepID=UPI00375755EE